MRIRRGIEIRIQTLDDGLPLPAYAHEDDAGLDLFAREDVVVPSGDRAVCRTGIAVGIPTGFAGAVVPRSGMAAEHGLTVLNAPGLIDPGYSGEVAVILANMDPSVDYHVRRGDRIAQLVIFPFTRARPRVVSRLSRSLRGNKGLGGTGR